MRAFLVAIVSASLLRAGDVAKMIERASQEAAAFARIAPEVLGRETIVQKALKPPSRFHPRVVTDKPPERWQTREVVSEYGFSALSSAPEALHELRQVISVDGHKVQDSRNAEEALAQTITTNDDRRKLQALKQLEKYGLRGAATDFGQLILLFTSRAIERYEFAQKAPQTLDGAPVDVFAYRQIDGPEALTLIEPDKPDSTARHLRLEGEIWVRAESQLPVRITLAALQGTGTETLREQAVVEYAESAYGALLPVSTLHQEIRGGRLVAENRFAYSDFHRFAASSAVKFGQPK